MARQLTVGILQFGSTHDKSANLDKIRRLLRRASADLIIMPEYSMLNIVGLSPEKVYELSEDLNGNFIRGISKIATEYSAHVVVGVIIRSSNPPKVFNTALLIGPSGDVWISYRKIHLFNAYGYRESDYMEYGSEPSPVVDIGKAKVAIAICFDIRFPELFRIYALSGAELIAIPAGWFKGPAKEETLSFLARCRAHENTVYIAIANQYSEHFTGRSMIVDPLGIVVADLGVGEKYSEHTIDIDYIYEVRKILPVLKLRRDDVYSKYLSTPQ